MTFPDTLVLEVTQDDIDNGKREQADSCPLARAARRALSLADTDYIEVGASGWYIDAAMFDVDDSAFVEDVSYKMSEAAIGWVEAFDQYRPVEPTTFVFERNEEPFPVVATLWELM